MRLKGFGPLYEGWVGSLCGWPIEERDLEEALNPSLPDDVSCAYELTRHGLGEAFRFRFSTALEASRGYFICALLFLLPSFLRPRSIYAVVYQGKVQFLEVFARHLDRCIC